MSLVGCQVGLSQSSTIVDFIDAKFPNQTTGTICVSRARKSLTTPLFRRRGAWRAIMPRLKIDIQKVQYLKQCQKLLSSLLPGLEVFCRDKRCHLYSYVAQNLREIGTLSAFCVNRDTTGTNAKIPGLSRSFRDTWQLCDFLTVTFLRFFFIGVILLFVLRAISLSRIRAIRESAYAARANVTIFRLILKFAVYAWCMPSSRFISPC